MLESIQSPAPFIVGLHRFLVSKVSDCQIEAHLLVDLDEGQVISHGIDTIPPWLRALIDKMKVGGAEELRAFINLVIREALGISSANSCRTIIRRMRMALESSEFEPNSFGGMLFNSRTMRYLLDEIKQESVSPEICNFLAFGSKSSVTGAAVLELDEFPLRGKSAVFGGRSVSMQFVKGPERSFQAVRRFSDVYEDGGRGSDHI
jgi:hypothetical protein